MLAANTVFQPGVKPAGWIVCTPSKKAFVIAARNEAGSIYNQIQQVLAEGDIAIVVDDNSVDGTAQAAESAGAMVIRADRLLSFSNAIRQAIRLAASLSSQVLVTRGPCF